MIPSIWALRAPIPMVNRPTADTMVAVMARVPMTVAPPNPLKTRDQLQSRVVPAPRTMGCPAQRNLAIRYAESGSVIQRLWNFFAMTHKDPTIAAGVKNSILQTDLWEILVGNLAVALLFAMKS